MSRLVLHTVIAVVACGQPVCAEEFAIQIGSPVAAQTQHLKRSTFVFRTSGCPAPSEADVAASAEGLVSGKRRSLPLKVMPAAKAGVYGIFREWPAEGAWVVHIRARCGSQTAAAVVATQANSFVRESSVFLKQPATEPEIESAIQKASRK